MNPIKHLKEHHSYPRYIIYAILFARWSYLEGCSFYKASAVTRFKMQWPWNKEHPLPLLMCFSASEYHFFFMRLSFQNWFCMCHLLVTLDWILAVGYDFFRVFFNCKSLAKPSCVDSCVTAAIFWKVFNIAEWAFF